MYIIEDPTEIPLTMQLRTGLKAGPGMEEDDGDPEPPPPVGM